MCLTKGESFFPSAPGAAVLPVFPLLEEAAALQAREQFEVSSLATHDSGGPCPAGSHCRHNFRRPGPAIAEPRPPLGHRRRLRRRRRFSGPGARARQEDGGLVALLEGRAMAKVKQGLGAPTGTKWFLDASGDESFLYHIFD